MTTANRATWKMAMGGTNTNTGRIGSSLAARDMPGQKKLHYRTKEQLRYTDEEGTQLEDETLNTNERKQLSRQQLKERLLRKEELLLAEIAKEDNKKGLLTNPTKRMDSIKLLLDEPRNRTGMEEVDNNTPLLLKEKDEEIVETTSPKGKQEIIQKKNQKSDKKDDMNKGNDDDSIELPNGIKDKSFILKQVEQYDDRDDSVYGDDDEESSDANDDDLDSDSSDEEDSSDDDEAFLRMELERIKQEKAEKERKEEEQRKKEEEEAQFEAMMKASSQTDSIEVNVTRFGSSEVKRKWRDDAVFSNQANDEPEKKKRFINDPIRSDFHKSFLKKYMK